MEIVKKKKKREREREKAAKGFKWRGQRWREEQDRQWNYSLCCYIGGHMSFTFVKTHKRYNTKVNCNINHEL